MDTEKRFFQFVPDNGKKVIACGAMIYTVNGFVIYPTTEEEQEEKCYDTFRTLPVVDEGYEVIDDEDLNDGIKYHIIGHEGDTVPLGSLRRAINYNARERVCDLADILEDAERHQITVTNLHPRNGVLLPDTVTVIIDGGIAREGHYRIDSDYPDSYLLPQRFCYAVTAGELYMDYHDEVRNSRQEEFDRIECQLADDIDSYIWFFNNPNLRLRVRSYRSISDIKDGIPDSWPECLRHLEERVNKRLEVLAQEYIEAHEKL